MEKLEYVKTTSGGSKIYRYDRSGRMCEVWTDGKYLVFERIQFVGSVERRPKSSYGRVIGSNPDLDTIDRHFEFDCYGRVSQDLYTIEFETCTRKDFEKGTGREVQK